MMYFNFSSSDDSAYRMYITSDLSGIKRACEKILNTLLPTKSDYLYNIIKTLLQALEQ